MPTTNCSSCGKKVLEAVCYHYDQATCRYYCSEKCYDNREYVPREKKEPVGWTNLPDELDAKLKNWFSYHAPEQGDPEKYEAIRSAGMFLARAICDMTPECADQSASIRKVREAVMTANAAIACKGK